MNLFLTFVIWQMLQMKFICIFPYRKIFSELMKCGQMKRSSCYALRFVGHGGRFFSER